MMQINAIPPMTPPTMGPTLLSLLLILLDAAMGMSGTGGTERLVGSGLIEGAKVGFRTGPAVGAKVGDDVVGGTVVGDDDGIKLTDGPALNVGPVVTVNCKIRPANGGENLGAGLEIVLRVQTGSGVVGVLLTRIA